MKKLACLAVVALLALPVAAQSWVVGEEVNWSALIGGYEYPEALSSSVFVGQGVFSPGNPNHGLFGVQWDGPVSVSSITVSMDLGNRTWPSSVLLYTSTAPGTEPVEVKATDVNWSWVDSR